MLYAVLGMYSIEMTIKRRMIKFWTRLVTGNVSKLSYTMYVFMRKLDQINSKRIHCIQSILGNSGRHGLWVPQSTTINLSIGKVIKQNLLDQFLQNWNSQLQDSSKGRNYNLFKNYIRQEKYVTALNSSLFYAMVRFRTASHKLPIETGRWNNGDLPDRKCQLCTTNDLGDVYHYPLQCPYFKNERRVYIDPHFYTS